jgi:hypothetical protein
MKKIYIPRSDYEVYFMPFEKKRPGRSEIEHFLKVHHPDTSDSDRIESKACKISGKSFLMITVLDNKKYPANFFFKMQYVTSSSIIFSLNHSETKKVFLGPQEIIVSGEQPESIPLNEALPETDAPERQNNFDRIFSSEAEILSLSKKNAKNNSISTGYSRVIIAVNIFFAVLIIGTGLFVLSTLHTIHENRTVPVIKDFSVPKKIQTVLFRNVFSIELKSLHESGSVLVQYSFNANRLPATRMTVRKGDAEKLYAKIKKETGCEKILIPAIKFTDGGRSEFTAEYTVPDLEPSSNDRPDPLVQSKILAKKLLASGITIQNVQLVDPPVYSVSFENTRLPDFISSLWSFCTQAGWDFQQFEITGSESEPVFSSLFSFAPLRENRKTVVTPERGLILNVFDIKEIKRPVLVKTTGSTDSYGHARVGKITDESGSVLNFEKNDKGKIFISKEKAE